MPKLFDSREDLSPFSLRPLPKGRRSFRICLPRPLKSTAALSCWSRKTAGEESRLEMFWAGMEGQDQEWGGTAITLRRARTVLV